VLGFDVVKDPIVGYLSDRSRCGHRVPWIASGVLILAVAMVAMSAGLSGQVNALWGALYGVLTLDVALIAAELQLAAPYLMKDAPGPLLGLTETLGIFLSCLRCSFLGPSCRSFRGSGPARAWARSLR
jgi:hypothetical protein